MSADQRKKRLSSANVFGYSSREQHRAKKKHLLSSQFDLNWKLNSHTPLKWDENEKRAVAKREQVGLSKRDLRPFKAPAHYDKTVADVIAIPSDVFELDDLAEVLSHEVWLSILTEKERSQLTQFLPSGVKPDEVVQSLLAGENFHFGNPFLKWSSALCSGENHPEAVRHSDESFRANRNAYYSELQKYHDNMIRNLQKMKDRCANANDPEEEIEQMTRRRREQYVREVRHLNREQSIAADEKAWSSDNQSPLKGRPFEIPKSKEVRKVKDEKQADVMKVASKSKKKDKFQKSNVNYADGSKYMSYVKISKSQHELVRSMKQSGNSIQSKALNSVIGNLSGFNVKPYVMFEEEEKKRIQEYWSNLAKKDIPSAFSKWGVTQSERREINKSLCLEIEEKLRLRLAEEMGYDDTEQNQEEEDEQNSDPSSANDQYPLQIPSLDANHKCSPMDLNEEDNHISPNSNEEKKKDTWPAITMVGSSFCSSSMDYTSIPLKPTIPEEKSLLPQQSGQVPFFSSYQNDAQQELLHTIIKRDSYHDQPKKSMLGFHTTPNLLIEPSQFPDPSFRAPNDFFLQSNIPENNIYPDTNRFSIPRPNQFTQINMREWNSAPRFTPPPMQVPLATSMDLLNPNWFPVENRAQPWPNPETYSNPNQNLASGSGGGDQSLFSVLTQCNNLRPPGNFADNLCIGMPRTNPVPVSPLDYLSGHEIAPSTLKTSDIGWMNLPHQSSSLHDPNGKPFPKPWNQ